MDASGEGDFITNININNVININNKKTASLPEDKQGQTVTSMQDQPSELLRQGPQLSDNTRIEDTCAQYGSVGQHSFPTV